MISTIAVGTDGSETAQKAVDFAVDLAKRYGAKLVLASAYEPVSDQRVAKEKRDAPEDVQWKNSPSEDVDAVLEDAQDKAKEQGLTTETEARTGDPADVLVAIAADKGADLLVVGSQGMKRRILGSVPNTVSHNAPCSVVIVKTD